MEKQTVSFYSEFQCLMGDCRESCCQGWEILLDEKILRYYRSVPGFQGLRLKLSTFLMREPAFAAGGGKCAFHDCDGLCGLQKKLGEEALPEICRVYPRMRKNYGILTEEWLDLSCIQAASLFLAHREELRLIKKAEENPPERHGNNDDYAFFALLRSYREKICLSLGEAARNPSPEGLNSLFGQLLSFAELAQSECVKERYSFFERDINSFSPDRNNSLYPFSPELLGELMDSGFSHKELKKKSPFLYGLCKEYRKSFAGRGKQEELKQFISEYLEASPERTRMLIRYYQYGLLSDYFRIFEDYSFRRHILRGIMDVNLLLLLFALFRRKYGEASGEDEARLLSSCERRTKHNERVRKTLLARLP
ncbi:MAG: flagellin lysine-N-methylase [Lachnospiraceae bacterium]|nr:flagellin lysine-N-methylase [Lachnospiraceae bacterium]